MESFLKRLFSIWIFFSILSFYTSNSELGENQFFILNHQKLITRLLHEISDFRHYGLISQYDSDMGDTLQRTGSYYTLLKFLNVKVDDLGRDIENGYDSDLRELTSIDGVFRRSNDPLYWGFDSNNCSRDQIFAVQSAIVTYHDFKRGRLLFQQFLQRGFLNQNFRQNWSYPWESTYQWKLPDIPTPSQLSLLLRGLGTWLVYPIIFILDSVIIADIYYFRNQNERELWDYDIKAFPSLIAANSYLPTIWSRLGLKLYLNQKHDIIHRIKYYNQVQFNGIKPLAEIYSLALDKLEDLNSNNLPNPEKLSILQVRQISSEK